MKIERATQLLFLLLISQGGNAAYANLTALSFKLR